HSEPAVVKRVLQAGASGFITKDGSSHDLLEAIRKVASGRRHVAPDLAEEILFSTVSTQSAAPFERLSKRECIVLQMLTQGHSLNQIAEKLHLSNKTISSHKTNLMEKLQVDNFADLVRYAIAHGLHV
ncbi:MAG: response regulator transcription factor, partial [Methylomonas sp.]|nr:response regulator transcription factor [Methylomonas sp.]